MKKAHVLTTDNHADLLERVVSNIVRTPQGKSTQPSIEYLRKEQDRAILRYELALEKRERVKGPIKQGAPLDEQLAALGGEDTLNPLQLVKLKIRHFTPSSKNSKLGDMI